MVYSFFVFRLVWESDPGKYLNHFVPQRVLRVRTLNLGRCFFSMKFRDWQLVGLYPPPRPFSDCLGRVDPIEWPTTRQKNKTKKNDLLLFLYDDGSIIHVCEVSGSNSKKRWAKVKIRSKLDISETQQMTYKDNWKIHILGYISSPALLCFERRTILDDVPTGEFA